MPSRKTRTDQTPRESSDCVSALARIERTIEAQKAFLHRVGDPDTRDQAETHQQTTPSAPFNLDALPGQATFGLANGQETPRLILRSSRSPFIVQLQSDRFAFSWARAKPIGEKEDYIGYDALKNLWSKYFETYIKWFSSVFKTNPDIMGAEITYTNALPIKKEDGTSRRLSEVFRFVSPGSRPVNAFTATWAELLVLGVNAPRVSASTGVGMHPLTGQHAIFYNFTGIGIVEGEGNLGFLQMLDALHERIHEMHTSSINVA